MPNRVGVNGENVERDQFAVLTERLQRFIFSRQHGMQYGSDRDIYRVGGYPATLSFSRFEAMYDRDPIASRVVDMPAETTWRAAPEVVEPETEDPTEFMVGFANMADRLRLWSRFERADKLSRIGRYGVVLIGTADGDDQNLQNPMPNLSGPDDVLYLAPYHENHAQIQGWIEDPTDPRYGHPEAYRINMAGDVASFRSRAANQTVTVHHTRVLHVAEGLLEDDVYGRESLRSIYNDLHDLQKVTTSTAEAYWQRVAGILQANVDPEARMDESDMETLTEQVEELYHDLRRVFAGQGVALNRMSESEPDPTSAANLYMQRIAAGCGIPKRMLFGSETGERSSTEDQKSYVGMIAERQVQHAEPNLLRAFVDRCIEFRALPRPRNGYDVVWPTLFKEAEKDIAEANRARAQTAEALTPVGGAPIEIVMVDEESNVWLKPKTADDPNPFELLLPEPELPGDEDLDANPIAEDDGA